MFIAKDNDYGWYHICHDILPIFLENSVPFEFSKGNKIEVGSRELYRLLISKECPKELLVYRNDWLKVLKAEHVYQLKKQAAERRIQRFALKAFKA